MLKVKVDSKSVLAEDGDAICEGPVTFISGLLP